MAAVLAAALVAQERNLGAAVGGWDADVGDLLPQADGLGELHRRAASDADNTVTTRDAGDGIVNHTLRHVDEGRIEDA